MPIAYDLDCFSDNYLAARDKFRLACRPLSGDLRSFSHPLDNSQQPLSTDVFWLGPKQADQVLVIISATHGVEGFCGSAAQVQWLRHERVTQRDTAVLLIHALNPFGFAHGRRVNENNIDLNRNFIDFDNIPVNPGYQELASVLLPDHFDDLPGIEKKLSEFRQQHAQSGLEKAVSGGQYHFPDGLFYGGTEPSWSHQLIKNILADYQLSKRKRLAVIDIHSGLGPYGYGEIICDHPPNSANTKLAKQWFGDSVTEPACGTSSSVPKDGLLDYAWYPAIADQGCYVTLEFGTYSVADLFSVLQEENFCWHRQVTETQKATAQLRMRDYFYPAKKDWQEMILFRSAQVISQALQGLSG